MKQLQQTYAIPTAYLKQTEGLRAEATKVRLGDVLFAPLVGGDYGGLPCAECHVAAIGHHSYTHINNSNRYTQPFKNPSTNTYRWRIFLCYEMAMTR